MRLEQGKPVVEPGDRIGKYRIERLLGSGGLARVYLAEQPFTGRAVALKLFETQDEGFLALAYREVATLAALDHPYIVRMYEADTHEGWFYLVMEYVAGRALSDLIAARETIPLRVVLQLMIDTGEALAHAHEQGVIHGDIKPNNIMVSTKGVPVLTDFLGSALVESPAREDTVIGTPGYMAPESWQGRPEARSDLWSLGLTFFQALTGRLPFAATDPEAIRQTVTAPEPLDLSPLRQAAPEPVARLVARCLQKRPADRYPSASALRRDLEAALAFVALGRSAVDADAALPLGPGRTIMLNVAYRESGIPGQYREYRIEAELGQGGFSQVFLAIDVIGRRPVALKILRPERASDEAVLRRFQREASLLARLDHPHLVRVYNYGEYGPKYFLVMEVLPGPTLGQALAARGRFAMEEAVAVAAQLLAGLAQLHADNVVHRDVKPDNVKLLPDRAVLMDLGIAHVGAETRLTRTGDMLGTPRYMAPEQARAEPVGPPGDLYAVGIILYELLTGRIPHDSDNLARLVMKIALEAPTPVTAHRPDLPPALVEATSRLLARAPEDRFATAAEARAALLAAVGLREQDIPSVHARLVRDLDLVASD